MILEPLTTVVVALTAIVGGYVAALAYRGYRRNDSDRMRLLAVGICFIAVVPYVVSHVANPLLGLTDAQSILGVTLSHVVGLAVLYQSVR